MLAIPLLVDVAVALCLLGFVATISLARYQLTLRAAEAAPPIPSTMPPGKP
jgi:multiple resistance and pH regulation protein F (MrpF/PhaF)